MTEPTTMTEQTTETQVQIGSKFNEEAFPKLWKMIQETQSAQVKEEGAERAMRPLITLVKEAMEGAVTIEKNLKMALESRIAEIDKLISTQLDAILHAPEFQKLEGSWRGLHYLVKNSLTGKDLRIRVLNVTMEELKKDFQRADRFDKSALWEKIYTSEYDNHGGIPYSVLLGDYEFGPGSSDMELLGHLSQVAAASFSPFISAAHPQFFGQDSYTDLGNVTDFASHFDQARYARWRAFRATEESKFVGLTLPHVLMREPYGPENKKVAAFDFQEDVTGKDGHTKYLWGNAAYAMGARLTEAFALHGWPVAIRGIEGGGAVLDLPTHTFETDEGVNVMKCPTELAISGTLYGKLAAEGFIPLCHVKNENYAVFYGAQSCQKALEYIDAADNANAQLSARLPYVLAVSRIAHHLNCITRDKIGGFVTEEQCKSYLSEWIGQYVSPDENAASWIKAQKPLQGASIQVERVPGNPGRYSAVVLLKPHVQFEALSAQLSLVAELPESLPS